MPACRPLPREDLEHILKYTRDLWAEIRGQSIFLTGGTGFFGTWLLESFLFANERLGLGARLVVLTRNPEAFIQKMPHLAGQNGLEFVKGDVRSFEFPAGKFTCVIHAATEASVKLNEESPGEMLDVILNGTQRVLDFCAQAGVRKLLFVSSGAVYGRQPLELTHVSETYSGAPDPLLRNSAYGEGKRVSEHLCAVDAQRLGYEAKVARGFAFVGPHLPLDGHFAMGNFIRDVLMGQPIKVTGDGRAVRSYLYASDLAVWLWTILFRGEAGRAYNVGSREALTIGQLARLIETTLRGEGASGADPSLMLGSPLSRYVPDVDRAASELGLECRVPLSTAICKTAEWHGWKQSFLRADT